jgi:mRNA-degrading endonuclease toxin of MazEF toxin-antitoxin module
VDINPGDIYFVDINPKQVVGSEQFGRRPFLIMSRLRVNQKGKLVVAVPFTTSGTDRPQPPFRILIPPQEIVRDPSYKGTPELSVALTDQVRAIDKARLETKMGTLSVTARTAVGLGLAYLFDLR